jgi:hypothetical protein
MYFYLLAIIVHLFVRSVDRFGVFLSVSFYDDSCLYQVHVRSTSDTGFSETTTIANT